MRKYIEIVSCSSCPYTTIGTWCHLISKDVMVYKKSIHPDCKLKDRLPSIQTTWD